MNSPLIELIQEAMKESPEFLNKMQYWIHKRKKQPDAEWLFNQLVPIVGLERTKVEFDKLVKT